MRTPCRCVHASLLAAVHRARQPSRPSCHTTISSQHISCIFQLLQALPHRHLAVVRDFTRTRRTHHFESHWSSKQVRSPNASIFTLNRSQITRSQQRRQVYQLKLCSLRQMTKTFLSTTNRYHHMLQHKCRTMTTTHKLQRCQTQTNIEVALKV